jgi:hypothetical protein
MVGTLKLGSVSISTSVWLERVTARRPSDGGGGALRVGDGVRHRVAGDGGAERDSVGRSLGGDRTRLGGNGDGTKAPAGGGREEYATDAPRRMMLTSSGGIRDGSGAT